MDCGRPGYPPAPDSSVEGVGLAPCVSEGGSDAARWSAVFNFGAFALADSVNDVVGDSASSIKLSSKSSSSREEPSPSFGDFDLVLLRLFVADVGSG